MGVKCKQFLPGTIMNKLLPLMFVSVLGCAACSDPEQGHVWKDQTDMIDKAEDVEKMLLEKSQQQRQLTDELTR